MTTARKKAASKDTRAEDLERENHLLRNHLFHAQAELDGIKSSQDWQIFNQVRETIERRPWLVRLAGRFTGNGKAQKKS